MWRSRTRVSSHRKRKEKIETIIKELGGEIQMKDGQQRRFEKIRLAVTKNKPGNAFFLVLWREIENHTQDNRLAPYR